MNNKNRKLLFIILFDFFFENNFWIFKLLTYLESETNKRREYRLIKKKEREKKKYLKKIKDPISVRKE